MYVFFLSSSYSSVHFSLSFCRAGFFFPLCDVYSNMGAVKEGGGQRERGALAVYVKAPHCLMLNTSFCTSCFRGLCMSVWWVGGIKLHAQMVTAHTTHWVHRWTYVQVNPWMKWIHMNNTLFFFSSLFRKPIIWERRHGCEIVLLLSFLFCRYMKPTWLISFLFLVHWNYKMNKITIYLNYAITLLTLFAIAFVFVSNLCHQA